MQSFITKNWTLTNTNIIKPEPELSDSEDNDESDTLIEYSAEPVHADGVPSSNYKLFPKNYRTPAFLDAVFELLRTELNLPGWKNLSDQAQSRISISKVGGSLTNAVFFVSCPSDPTPANPSISTSNNLNQNLIGQISHHGPPPTVLLRIYGPSSGTLISRKEELHLLHTLSTKYRIGPLLLGTFANGRVEQFFKSRPLTKEEVRDPTISTWIARKMSELHSVDPFAVINPDQVLRNQSQSSCRATSLNSESKWISYSPSLNHTASPINTPQMGSSLSSRSTKAGVWNNITRWQHEATKVFAGMAKTLEALQVQSMPTSPPTSGLQKEDSLAHFRACPPPLSSPQALSQLMKIVDLPRFILEMKSYRLWIVNHEKIHGKSQRVFSHNDTQCGNLLLRQDDDAYDSKHPQDQIIVIDFEYASVNPRGFDIANHFHEWCADYHHLTHSYSLTRHGNYPTYGERKVFYRAYLGLDTGNLKRNDHQRVRALRQDSEISEFDLDVANQPGSGAEPGAGANPGGLAGGLEADDEEDGEVTKLEQDVTLWSPASHAMWALWGLVQARDDLQIQLDRWLLARDDPTHPTPAFNMDEFEFDYFSYSAERIILFRSLLAQLKIPTLAQ